MVTENARKKIAKNIRAIVEELNEELKLAFQSGMAVHLDTTIVDGCTYEVKINAISQTEIHTY